MVERLRHEGTSHSSSDLMKIFVKMVEILYRNVFCDLFLNNLYYNRESYSPYSSYNNLSLVVVGIAAIEQSRLL